MQMYLAKHVKVAFQSPAFNGKLLKKPSEPIEPTFGRSAKIQTTLTPVDKDNQHQITELAKRIGMTGSSKTGKPLAGVKAGGTLRWGIRIAMGIHASSLKLVDNDFPKSTIKAFIRVRDDFSHGILESICDIYQQEEEKVKLTVHLTEIQCISEDDCVTVWPQQLSLTDEEVTIVPPMWYGVEKTGLCISDSTQQDYWKLTDCICGWSAYVTIIATVPDHDVDNVSTLNN